MTRTSPYARCLWVGTLAACHAPDSAGGGAAGGGAQSDAGPADARTAAPDDRTGTSDAAMEDAAAGLTAGLTVGTGWEHFAEVEPGQALPLVFGPQGGFHVWGAARVLRADPGPAALHFTLLADATAGPPLAEAFYGWEVPLALPAEFAGAAVALFEPRPSAVTGRTLILRLVLVREGRVLGRDEVTIAPTWDETE